MNTIFPMPAVRAALPLGLALLLAGCATTPRLDRQFGDSVRATLAQQVANPAAAHNPNPVNGIDGRAARAAQEQYEKSFGKAEASGPAPGQLLTR
jgi:type IV pilus biogenesis protein CpaD/CtpE